MLSVKSFRTFYLRLEQSSAGPLLWRSLALVLVCVAVGCDSFERRGVAPGDAAPEIKAATVEGEPFILNQTSGNVVLINFWATWCAPCVQELPALERLQQRFKGQKFTVLGVAIDDEQESIAQFRAQYGLTFPLINDARGTSKAAYKLTGVPETVLLDRNGKIVMFVDPESGQPVAKISGERDWDGPVMIKQIEKLLQ